MKNLAAILLMVAAVALWASPAAAVDYNPNTTIVVYVHGFDTDGYADTGVFGDDEGGGEVNQIAALTGFPTWQTNPNAPNQVCATDYYGATPPSWYTAADIAEEAATPYAVPKYALRVAKYIQHVLDRAPGATGVTLLGASFGGEITRYIIENDVYGFASTGKIARWIPVVGVVRGNWAASNAPDWLAELVGIDSPDVDDMAYDWVDSHISAHNTLNSTLMAPIIITQFVATNDPDGYLTLLTNDPNDAVNMVSDEYFSGYTNSAALHAATDGTLQMPGKSYQSTYHQGIADAQGMWAGAIAAATNNQRVTITISRFKAKAQSDWFDGDDYCFRFNVTSPQAAALWGITSPLQNMIYSDGVSPVIICKKNQTKYPNTVMFDQIVPPGETQLGLSLQIKDIDWYPTYYDMYEPGPASTDMGTLTTNVSATSGSVVTQTNSKVEVDFTTAVHYVY
jgi:hypothetical protein